MTSHAMLSIALAVLGLGVSGLSLALTTYRARTADVVAVAQRLTALEKAGDALPKGLAERLAGMEQRMIGPERLAERLATLEQKSLLPERFSERLASIEQAVSRLPEAQPLINRLVTVETKIDLFWRGLSIDAARVLHSPHPEFARRDKLLEAFMAHQLSAADAVELGEMLLNLFDDHEADPGERMAAAVVLKYLHTEYSVSLDR